MKWIKPSSALFCMLVAVALPISLDESYARDAVMISDSLDAGKTTKQCISACRARYRDCRRLNQLPSFECQGVYQDCRRYSCTGLGPG